jgi:hypothetical protein
MEKYTMCMDSDISLLLRGLLSPTHPEAAQSQLNSQCGLLCKLKNCFRTFYEENKIVKTIWKENTIRGHKPMISKLLIKFPN